MSSESTQNYSADSIQALEGMEHVRKRPSMYIGDVGVRGLHHLVYEVVDNSIDEAMAGHCSEISVIINEDDSISVEDNGRGIPVGIHQKEGVSALEVVMTKIGAGGKFDKDSYKVSGGLHGVGVSVVNALSDHLKATVFRDGKIWEQEYEKGKTLYAVRENGKSDKTGTLVTFKPDVSIFKDVQSYNYETLSNRMRELSFLNKGITINLTDRRKKVDDDFKKESFHSDEGLKEFIKFLDENREPLIPEVISIEGQKNDVPVEIAMIYNSSFNDILVADNDGSSSPTYRVTSKINRYVAGWYFDRTTSPGATRINAFQLHSNKDGSNNGNRFIIRDLHDTADSIKLWSNGDSFIGVTTDGTSRKLGIGTDNPLDLLDVFRKSSTAYDATADDAQRNTSASITVRNDDGTTNSFSQLVFDTAGNNQSIARIVAIRSGSASNHLAFVTEHSNTKAERLRIKSDGNVGVGTDITSAGGAYGKMSVVIPSQSGGAALQVMNSAVGSGDGNLTNIVLRSVNNNAANWAHAEYRASSHDFMHETTSVLKVESGGVTVTGTLSADSFNGNITGAADQIKTIQRSAGRSASSNND